MTFDLDELDALQEQLARAYETLAEETRSTPLRQRALVLAAARDPSFCKSVHAKALAHFAGKHQKEKRDHRGEGRVLVKLVERSFEYYETSMREAQKHGRPEAARGVAVCIAVPFIKQLSYLPALQDLTDLAPRHTSPESFTRATGLATETIAKAILAERNPDPAKVARLVLLKLKCPKRTAEDVCPSKKKSNDDDDETAT